MCLTQAMSFPGWVGVARAACGVIHRLLSDPELSARAVLDCGPCRCI